MPCQFGDGTNPECLCSSCFYADNHFSRLDAVIDALPNDEAVLRAKAAAKEKELKDLEDSEGEPWATHARTDASHWIARLRDRLSQYEKK